jgi:hypothetical protein
MIQLPTSLEELQGMLDSSQLYKTWKPICKSILIKDFIVMEQEFTNKVLSKPFTSDKMVYLIIIEEH